jgi:signal transduction histidine kinase/CheY-like chemotaxis protein
LFGVCTETTSRFFAERRERVATDRQRRLFEQAPGFIIIMRGDEHVVEFINDAHKTVFNSADWIDRTIRDAFPSIAGQGFFEILDDVYATGRTFEAQGAPVRYRRTPDGPEETRYLTFIYAPLYDEAGTISGIFCEGFDVSEGYVSQRRAAALVELNDRFRAIEDPEALAYATAEILGKLFEVSRAGYGTIDTRSETISIERDWNAPGIRSLAGVLNFRDYGSYIEELKQGTTVVCEDAETDPRTAEMAGALEAISARSFVNMPVTEQGDFVALLYLNHEHAREWSIDEVAFIRDVAERTRTAVERRRAEATLRANAARLTFLDRLGRQTASSEDADEILAITTRAVAEHLGISNCAYADMDEDQDGFTIRGDWAAPGSPSIVGHYSLADFGELAVRNLGAGEPLIVNDNLVELAPHEAKTFQDIGIAATICMPLVKDGRLTALMAIHDRVPHRWSHNELALIREVTERSWAHIERVRSEEERRASLQALADLNATLESQVSERTQELMAAEETLRQSQKMEAVGQLTGGLAHDFNNILAGIGGSLELMQTRLAQGRISDLDRYLTGALGGAKRAASLTQRLLAFSRRQTLDPQPADLNRLVVGMQDLINRSVGPEIEVEAAGAGGLWTTFVDVGQLENALLNLCINARDAMPDGGKLTIETANRWLDESAAKERGVAPGQYVSLCVSDTGTGMSAETIARAFDPFFTTKPTGQGTGLGLSMVYGFAGQSNGSVRIYSEPDRGTMVCIYLPRHIGEFGTQDILPDLSAAPRASDHETILVVDDEPLVRMVAVEILEELGYNVIEAGDGPQALRILNSDRVIDLLVTDVGLPNGMNGRQLADAARAERPRLQVLFITGCAENAVLNHGHLDPGMHVMTKPFVGETFGRRVRELISKM